MEILIAVAIVLAGLIVSGGVVFGPTIRMKLFKRKAKKGFASFMASVLKALPKVVSSLAEEKPELILDADEWLKKNTEDEDYQNILTKIQEKTGIPFEELILDAQKMKKKDTIEKLKKLPSLSVMLEHIDDISESDKVKLEEILAREGVTIQDLLQDEE